MNTYNSDSVVKQRLSEYNDVEDFVNFNLFKLRRFKIMLFLNNVDSKGYLQQWRRR